jgi:cell wall assembly regulator SMI1
MSVASGPNLHSLLHQLTEWLSEHRASAHAKLRPGASAQSIEQLQKKLRLPIPHELSGLLTWHDGLPRDELVFDDYRLLSASEIGSAATMLRGHLKAGEFEAYVNWWVDGWIPFLGDDADNYLCLDTVGSFAGVPGQVVQFHHDDADRYVVAPSLTAWIQATLDTADPAKGVGRFLEDTWTKALPGFPRAAAADKNTVKVKARVTARDAIRCAVDTLKGPNPELVVAIERDKVLKAAQFEVGRACNTLLARRASATAQIFEVLPEAKGKKIAYAVWSSSTVGETWRDGYVLGFDLKGGAIYKDKKVSA